MKAQNPVTAPLYKLLFMICLVAVLVISDNPVISASPITPAGKFSTGYSALKLFLADEQHLTLIRRTKMIITFDDISDRSRELIDAISDSSEKDLRDLEKLASARPLIQFREFSEASIAIATLDSLRMTTAREFLFEAEDFEKNILISQLNILRVISHLAGELEQSETNSERKKWLADIARRYEKYYQQVNALITISGKKHT